MNPTTQAQRTPAASIDPTTEVSSLSLVVADLARSLAFYTEAIGFSILERDQSRATLGVAGRPLLVLTEHPGARPWPHDVYAYTGLYHFAILVPTRVDLGLWLRHWLDLGFPLPGQGDHAVSEALYVSDPDGNGIEVYRDRPRDQWRWVDGRIQMGSDPVDIRGILDDAARSGRTWAGFAPGTRLGHIHLQVGDIARASALYHDILGFDVIAQMPSALFISAGGYHHHIGLNTWHSKNAPPAPEGTAGLRSFVIALSNPDALNAVVARLDAAGVPHTGTEDVVVADPWNNTIILRIAPSR